MILNEYMQIKDIESKSSITNTLDGSLNNEKSLENPNKVSERVDINVLNKVQVSGVLANSTIGSRFSISLMVSSLSNMFVGFHILLYISIILRSPEAHNRCPGITKP